MIQITNKLTIYIGRPLLHMRPFLQDKYTSFFIDVNEKVIAQTQWMNAVPPFCKRAR